MIETFFQNGSRQLELQTLRALILKCGLSETMKWKNPCYTSQNRNIVMLGRLKDHVVLSFFRGAGLEDQEKLLERPGENTRSARVIRFRNLEEITGREQVIIGLIQQAIQLEDSKERLQVKPASLNMPAELKAKLEESPEFNAAFEKLTPGRQRGYCLHFSSAKQSKTRLARIERYRPRIMNGKGLRDCDCGLSKKMPQCDGSHNRR